MSFISIPPLDITSSFWDIDEAIRHLLPISAKWKLIGRAMGIKNHILDAIEKDTDNPKERFSRTFIHWIEFGNFTWCGLVAAVETSDGGNSPMIASKIMSHHIKVRRPAGSTPIRNAITPRKAASPYTFSEERWYTEQWYHGRITCQESEERLEFMSDGSFLVRNSFSSRGDYNISMKCNGEVVHFLVRVLRNPYGESTYEIQGSKLSFQSIPDLIRYYKSNPISIDQERLIDHCPNPSLCH